MVMVVPQRWRSTLSRRSIHGILDIVKNRRLPFDYVKASGQLSTLTITVCV